MAKEIDWGPYDPAKIPPPTEAEWAEWYALSEKGMDSSGVCRDTWV